MSEKRPLKSLIEQLSLRLPAAQSCLAVLQSMAERWIDSIDTLKKQNDKYYDLVQMLSAQNEAVFLLKRQNDQQTIEINQ